MYYVLHLRLTWCITSFTFVSLDVQVYYVLHLHLTSCITSFTFVSLHVLRPSPSSHLMYYVLHPHLTSCIASFTFISLHVLHPSPSQAAKCKWRALRHTCLLLLSVLGGMPASHQGMQARLFFCGRYLITVMYTEKS